ncbi:cupin domain-containing protein [Archaeoglobales archaeon]|nr:MAG: cupin domain-containing protein [Archaeoglobales archaeon]
MKFEKLKWVDRGNYRVARVFNISNESFVQLVEIKPKSEVEKHYHKHQTEIFVILDGEAKLGIGSKEWLAKPKDIFLCKPKDVHWVENDKEYPFILVVFKHNWVENDTVWI